MDNRKYVERKRVFLLPAISFSKKENIIYALVSILDALRIIEID
jgi:hypothetical protein